MAELTPSALSSLSTRTACSRSCTTACSVISRHKTSPGCTPWAYKRCTHVSHESEVYVRGSGGLEPSATSGGANRPPDAGAPSTTSPPRDRCAPIARPPCHCQARSRHTEPFPPGSVTGCTACEAPGLPRGNHPIGWISDSASSELKLARRFDYQFSCSQG
jgi:hypothetical protein